MHKKSFLVLKFHQAIKLDQSGHKEYLCEGEVSLFYCFIFNFLLALKELIDDNESFDFKTPFSTSFLVSF
jgi:hypothetical protein